MLHPLKLARLNAGLKQTDVCEEVGVSVPTLIRWESGKVVPNAPQFAKMCELYKVSTDELFSQIKALPMAKAS